MSSSDGEGTGPKPKPTASPTLAGIPSRDAPPAPSRAPLPPPKAPPGGRPHAPPTMPPPLRREVSGAGPLPQPPAGATPTSGPYAAPAPPSPPSGPHAFPAPTPPSGPYAAPAPPTPPSGPYAAPAPPTPPSGPHAFPAPQPNAAFPSQPPAAAPAPFAAQVATHHQPAFATTEPGPISPIGAAQAQLDALDHPDHLSAGSLQVAPGALFVQFLKLSARRALSLRIDPSEVLPTERAALERVQPPIFDASLQAFLTWRRSVLLLVAVALVPLGIISLVDALLGSSPAAAIRMVKLGPALAEALFCGICWSQLKHWLHWREQRRKLFWGWLLFMAVPFAVSLYPLRTALEPAHAADATRALDADAAYRDAVMPFVFAMLAMLQLAPKAISLMPGIIRASLAIKLLFPGSTAPGWIIAIGAPVYALLAYVVLIVPYQFTGSGWFVAGVLGVVAGQVVLARAGFALARPLAEDEAQKQIRRIRTYYRSVMIASAVLIVVAMWRLIDQLAMRATDIITAVMRFELNVLILTLVVADLAIAHLGRARSAAAGKAPVEDQVEAEVKLAAFISLDAPLPPPPPGAAP